MRRKIRYEAKQSERRTIRRFLWWPVIIDGEWRWLESAAIRQHFWAVGRRGMWVNEGWEDAASPPASPREERSP